ncbi:MAG: hypothetical protein KDD89_09485 [Anaerolineales bacterium]|nr:hypothetical protein [Anaerolineales bacterium]
MLEPIDNKTPLFFPVSRLKLVVMSFCTLGLYQIYWFYENWQLYREREEERIYPLIRAVLAIVYAYALFKEVKQAAQKYGASLPPNIAVLAGLYVVLNLLGFAPTALVWLSLTAVFVLLPIQEVVNEVNRRATPDVPPNAQFTPLNFVALLVGSVVWGILLTAVF